MARGRGEVADVTDRQAGRDEHKAPTGAASRVCDRGRYARLMAASETGARTRILDAAYDLFSRRGIRGVGIDAVVAQSGVSRMTLYRHFRSKQDLVLAYLQCREEQW